MAALMKALRSISWGMGHGGQSARRWYSFRCVGVCRVMCRVCPPAPASVRVLGGGSGAEWRLLALGGTTSRGGGRVVGRSGRYGGIVVCSGSLDGELVK